MARPDAPEGLQERPFGYDGPIYTLSQIKAYGRQCAAYEKQKQEATIQRYLIMFVLREFY